jgi:hypothetical protein
MTSGILGLGRDAGGGGEGPTASHGTRSSRAQQERRRNARSSDQLGPRAPIPDPTTRPPATGSRRSSRLTANGYRPGVVIGGGGGYGGYDHFDWREQQHRGLSRARIPRSPSTRGRRRSIPATGAEAGAATAAVAGVRDDDTLHGRIKTCPGLRIAEFFVGGVLWGSTPYATVASLNDARDDNDFS